MIGARVLPPIAGSPLRRRCSVTNRERFFLSRRGLVVGGSTITSTAPVLVTASIPKPSRRQRLRYLTSLSRPLPRDDILAASHTSSHAPARSTACKTSSRLKDSFNSPITTIGGSSALRPTRSQPPTSPLTVKPRFSRKLLTGW